MPTVVRGESLPPRCLISHIQHIQLLIDTRLVRFRFHLIHSTPQRRRKRHRRATEA